jgi:hypothetical protein
MKYIKKYESFINEEEPADTPEHALVVKTVDIHKKISELKAQMDENPEQAGIITAKIKVEQEKIQLALSQRAVEVEKKKYEMQKDRSARMKVNDKELEKRIKDNKSRADKARK